MWNHDLTEAYASMLDFKQVVSFCEKALELHESMLGKNFMESFFLSIHLPCGP
jgi:hypothetical protein